MSKKEKSNVRDVDNFIERLRSQDFVINQEAEKLQYVGVTYFGVYREEPISLSEGLGHSISQYETNKDPSKQSMFADGCLVWINRAFSHGVVQEGKGLISKNKELEKENELLRDRLKECRQKCQEMETEMAELRRKYFDEKGDTLVGDVR